MQDFSEPLQNIVDDWAKHNIEKFDRALGGEFPGVDQAADTFWQGVTPKYEQRKRNAGYPDWLMVRTGQLKESMTNPERFFNYVSATSATFGVPLNEESQKAYAGNWLKRQLAFLDVSDKRMIRAHFTDYLNYGHDYKGQKMRTEALKSEAAESDILFHEAVG